MQVRKFEGADGLVLAGEVAGDPRRGVVLLAHGGGQTRHAWKNTARSLADVGWRAVSIDLRGHGDSDWSPTGDYAIESFAADLIKVAASLDARPHLIGASLGGIAGIAVETSLAPGTFASLTLVDVTPRMDRAGAEKIMGFMRQRLDDGFASLDDAADAIAAYLPHRPRPPTGAGLKKNLRLHPDGRYRWHWDPKFATGMDRRRERAPGGEQEERLHRLAVPVHLIRGAMSELVTPEAAAEFIRLVPHARYTDVAGAGHMVAGDKNDAFAAAAIAFLDGQSGR